MEDSTQHDQERTFSHEKQKDQTLHNPLTVLWYLCVCGSSLGLRVKLRCEHWFGIMHNALEE